MRKEKIIIIGSGFGGLLCGAILSKYKYQVTILEKNKQTGGCLQGYGIDGQLFEPAVHYLGSLDKGQTLYKILNFLELIPQLSIHKLDEDCFDKIIIEDKEYPFAQGYHHFVDQLAQYFPHQKEQLTRFVEDMQYTCRHFPLYHLEIGSAIKKRLVSHFSLKQKLDEHITDDTLKLVLAGNHLLYAGEENTTPFYIHALIENSYIEGSWKCKKGSYQIVKALESFIKKHHGEIIKNCDIIKIKENEGKIEYIENSKGQQFFADYYISNLHPTKTFEILETSIIKKITKKRIAQLPNTLSAVMVNLTLQKECIEYKNHNIYYHKNKNIWADLNQSNSSSENFNPNSFGVFYYQDPYHLKYANRLSILCYMNHAYFTEWEKSFNINTKPTKPSRSESYFQFKTQIGMKIVEEIDKIIPHLKTSISKIDISTPLTYRDYLNIPNGSMYGVKKNVNDLDHLALSTKTKIKNLFLTGQNINMHGILGVAITSILTSSELLGLNFLIDEINFANRK